MKIGTNDIANVKIGSIDVSEIRIGTTLVWQRPVLMLMAEPPVEPPVIEETTTNSPSVLSSAWSFVKRLFKFG